MKARKQPLQFLVQALEPGRQPLAWFGPGLLPGQKLLIHLLIQHAHFFGQPAQVPQMLLARLAQPVHNNAIESFLGRNCQELFGQSDVLLAHEPQAIDEPARLLFRLLDAFADFNLLLARQ